MKSVIIKVDMENREKLKRLHSATHIVNFAAKKVLGNHVWQNGSNLKAESGTLDITHYDNLSLDEIFLIEREANNIVFLDKKIFIEEIDRVKAEKKYGFTLYQGGAVPMKTLRVVKIEDSDIEACGGLHMESTGGIGLIKIVDSSKIQDGVVRLKFVVNSYALELVENDQKVLRDAQDVFSVEKSSVVSTCVKFFNDWKAQKKKIDSLKVELKKSYVDSINSSKKSEFVLNGDFDMGFLLEVFNSVLGKHKSFKLVSDKFVIVTSDVKVDFKFKKSIDKNRFVIYIL